MVIRYHSKVPGNEGGVQPKIFIGRLIHSKSLKDLEIIPRAAIGVTTNGTIAFVDSEPATASQLQTRYANEGFAHAQVTTLTKSQFLFPGLIDTHLHAPQWPNLALGMEGTLREWCENYTDPMEASYSSTSKARRVYADVTKTTLALGSTTVAYNSSIHAEATNILADCALKAGQRAIVGKMCITAGSTHGNWEESAEVSLADSEKSVKYIRSIDPEDRTLELHPNYTCYSDMYLASLLLTPRTILAHCIYLQPRDLDNLSRSRAGVAHNPNSNTCLRDGDCRVRDLLDRGIKVGLGTDCSAGYMPSIHDAMRSASNVSRNLAVREGEGRYVLGFSEVVWLGTMGGAEVVGMEDLVGTFETGKRFDALVVDVEGVISADAGLWEDGEGDGEAMVKKWVFLGDKTSIKKVYVDGKLVAGQDAGV
ncbi:hypothetical protein LTS16_012534 [Friedmanniomyces endolithicus]|nr:hypothetical protein LTR38_010730 [Friedmanniomyces endolithicus]KAK0794404.1 hypothetical protein LTR59_007823 [Friedmanniomyces endolithicus]KAK1037765.1 hypothetical protein LTS16_012534 [Friedmanniomyces endolithicus]